MLFILPETVINRCYFTQCLPKSCKRDHLINMSPFSQVRPWRLTVTYVNWPKLPRVAEALTLNVVLFVPYPTASGAAVREKRGLPPREGLLIGFHDWYRRQHIHSPWENTLLFRLVWWITIGPEGREKVWNTQADGRPARFTVTRIRGWTLAGSMRLWLGLEFTSGFQLSNSYALQDQFLRERQRIRGGLGTFQPLLAS